ncbi:hypothetical protein [Pedosphaera parvula]|nr:hypothetical protein [Pedosphaera parvula]
MSTNYARLDTDVWLFEIESGNPAQFPKQLNLLPGGDAPNNAKLMERMGGISIGIPKELYFGVWEVSNAQCHATLITTTNSDYLMLERLN